MSGGAGFGGGGPSTADAVKSARETTDSVQEQFNAARKNPEKELGIPLDELERRQREARKPRAFVSEETQRRFEVKSSARAQQIMNKGIDKYQRDKRQKDLKSNLSMLRKVQVMLCVCATGFFGWLAITYLLPQYAAVQNRNRRMELRFERAQQRLAASGAAETLRDASAGPVVRVFRADDEVDKAAKQPPIQ